VSRLASRLTATALVTGAALAAAALPAAAADHGRQHYPERSNVVLGAVQYDSPGRDNRTNASLNAEWVTVANTGRSSVDLSGWTLSGDDHHAYRFHHLWLAGHASVRVHTGIGRDTRSDVYQDLRTYAWDNDDTATLRDSRGRLVDTKSWGYRDHRGDNRGDHDRDHRGDNRGDHDRDHRGDNRGDHDRDHRGDHRH
jgi:Lamin Tail Domain